MEASTLMALAYLYALQAFGIANLRKQSSSLFEEVLQLSKSSTGYVKT